MAALAYAGIGARATPAAVLADMTLMAGWLARTGWNLATGGADGADSAFAGGAPVGQRTIWLPWRGYNRHRGPDCRTLSAAAMAACMEIAAPLHPAWERCSPAVRKLHARNTAVLLGETLDRPVDAVVCWSERGAVTGGTGMAIRIAEARGIPVLNLGSMSPRAVCERLAAIRGALRRRSPFLQPARSPSPMSVRPAPPESERSAGRSFHYPGRESMTRDTESVFARGAVIVPDFVTPAEEERILLRIAQAPWMTELRRRVQHYGYRYSYNDEDGALAAERLARRCARAGVAATVVVPAGSDFNDDLVEFGAAALRARFAPLFRCAARGGEHGAGQADPRSGGSP